MKRWALLLAIALPLAAGGCTRDDAAAPTSTAPTTTTSSRQTATKFCPGTYVPTDASHGDGLPSSDSHTTRRGTVAEARDAYAAEAAERYPDAAVSVGDGGGYEWYTDAAGTVQTRKVKNYAIYVELPSAAACPSVKGDVNLSYNGIEVRFLQ